MTAILETEPLRPRAANPAIPRDLETVLLTAVAKNPAHRYATAAALADDLRRVQAGRPILARRIGPLGQLKLWAKRHPIIAGLVAALLLAVTAGTTTVTLLWRQSERRRIDADVAFQQARDAVDECFLAATEHASFQGPGLQPAKEELLRRAGKYYERFLAQRADDPAVARYHRLLGQSLIQLGRREEAGRAHAVATARLEALLAGSLDAAALRLELGRVCAQEGRRLTDAFQNAEVEIVLRRGVVALTGGAADDPTAQLVLARLHYGLSILLRRLNRVPESAAHLHDMDRITRRLLALDPNRDDFIEDAGLARKAIGSFALMHGDDGKPYGWHMTAGYREGADLYRRLYNRHGTVLRYRANMAQALDSLGVCLRLEQKYADSEACFLESLTHFDDLASGNKDQPELKLDLAKTRYDYGVLLRETGRLDEARGQYDQAIRTQEALIEKYGHKRYKLDLAISRHGLGIACERGRDDATAAALFTQAIDALDQLLQGTSESGNQDFRWNVWMNRYARGMLRWRAGERDGAAADFACPMAGDKHVWRLLFLQAFRGDAAVVADAERLAAAAPPGDAAIDAAAVIAMSGTFPGLTAAERDRRHTVAAGLLTTA